MKIIHYHRLFIYGDETLDHIELEGAILPGAFLYRINDKTVYCFPEEKVWPAPDNVFGIGILEMLEFNLKPVIESEDNLKKIHKEALVALKRTQKKYPHFAKDR